MKSKKRRLGIFVFYHPDGIVHRYVLYLLRDMRENLDELIIVCNGHLSPEGRILFSKLTKHVVTRKNEGLDAAAYKFAMTKYWGWERVAQYDELVLFNDTIFGPFHPFCTVFDEMEKRNVDFWGMTCHHQTDYFPSHLGTYFMVFCNGMHRRHEFKTYWDNLKLYLQYDEVVYKHEVLFTHYLESKGFVWDAYVDMRKWNNENRSLENETLNYNLFYFETYYMLSEKKLPVLKKRYFVQPLENQLQISRKTDLFKCLEFIKANTDYDINMIWEYLLLNYHVSDIFEVMGLEFVLRVDGSVNLDENILQNTIIIVHVSNIENINFIGQYIAHIPNKIQVLITTYRNDVDKRLIELLGSHSNIKIRLIPNNGNCLVSSLISLKNDLSNFEYICFCHDEMNKNNEITTEKDSISLILDNLLASETYIYDVLDLFQKHERLGLAVPPSPVHGRYRKYLKDRWAGSFDKTRKLADKLHLSAPMIETKMPLTVKSAFWCRYNALKLLFDYPWDTSDLAIVSKDQTSSISSAIDRILSFVAQEVGYYTAWIMSPHEAALEARNMRFIAETMSRQSTE